MARRASDMGGERPTTLGLALLGLICAQPRSGYALRMVFEHTPIGRFSSSPGSIYPALKKLESLGLIETRPATGSKAFHLTEVGQRELRSWLEEPVTAVEYDRDPDFSFLRFAFLDAAQDSTLSLRYLQSFASALKESLTRLRLFLQSAEGQSLRLHGALAVRYGVSAREAALHWVLQAQDAIAAAATPHTQKSAKC